MFKGALKWPLFIAIMMMFSQQLSGINVGTFTLMLGFENSSIFLAMFYSTKIFKDAGLPGNWPFYATILMGAVNVAQTLVSLWLVDHPKFGRRSLHLIGLIGMLVASVLIVISLSIAVSSEKSILIDLNVFRAPANLESLKINGHLMLLLFLSCSLLLRLQRDPVRFRKYREFGRVMFFQMVLCVRNLPVKCSWQCKFDCCNGKLAG